jgi:hypothetical protein
MVPFEAHRHSCVSHEKRLAEPEKLVQWVSNFAHRRSTHAMALDDIDGSSTGDPARHTFRQPVQG